MRRVIFDQRERVSRWVVARVGGALHDQQQAIGYERDGELIAGCLFDRYVGRAICMHVAGEGLWCRPEFLKHCFGYVFNQLQCTKAIGLVDSANTKARRLDEHLGFRLEATVTDGAEGGDLLIYTMTRAECPWLGESHGQEFRAERT